MRTRSSSNLHVVSSSNPSTSNPKRRNRRRSKKPFILEESPVDTMADQRTMVELLRAPTEGYAKVIMVPSILVEQFELKHRAARRWLEKEPSHSIHTWEDLVSKFINEFFPPSRTTNLRNEISNFQQRFDESFHEAWDRYKDLLCACPHYGFTELHQLDTFYYALNPADQDSLNAATGGNLLETHTQDVLTIIENKSKVHNSRNKSVVSQVKSCDANSNFTSEIAKLTHAVNQQTSAVTTVMTAILKQFQATPPPASVKAVEETCVTCGGAHPHYQWSGSLPSNIVANLKGKLKAITTRSGIVLDGPTVPTPRPFINLEEDERVEETLTDPDLSEYTIKVPPPSVQKYKPLSQREYVLHINITLADALILMPKYQKMLKALLSNKEKLQELENTPLNENCSTVILKKLPEKLGDPGKFLIPDVFVPVGKFTFPVDFVIVDYESDPRVPLILGRPFLRTTRALIDVHELINLINVFNNSSEDFLEDQFSTNQPCGNPTFHPELTSPEVNDDIFDLEGGNVLPEKLLDHDSTKDLHPPLHVNPLSGSTTYSSSPNSLLEELADEDIDSSLKDSIDQKVESDTKSVYDDPFDSKGEKIKESKLLIDELDLPCDFFPSEYGSFISQDFSRVDSLPITNNEDKVFNPGILSQENSFEIITRVVQEKKLAISNTSLVLEDFDPPFYEPLFFKEVPRSKMLLPFSSKNEEKNFKLGIHTSEKVHSSFIPELSHQGYKFSKSTKFSKA
nr:reverse transcriptase domain-containing protein [Tanacetum cinerariifolium]